MTLIKYLGDKHPINQEQPCITYKVPQHKEVQENMSGYVGGAFTNVGSILVLFILLVIIACSCGIFGGF